MESCDPVTILFFGPQGAGKGTQVKLLLEYLTKHTDRKSVHLDMGQLLRDMVAAGTYSGELVHEVLINGLLMPDFMPIYLATGKLVQQLTGEEHIIADGLARRHEQTLAWDEAMKFYKRDNFCVIDLELSEDVSIQRLLARGRNDDTIDAIKRRLAWHKSEVEPQLEFLRSRNRPIYTIDGSRNVEEVHADILKALGFT